MSDVVAISLPKLAQVVASEVRKRIVSGELIAGEFLPFEAELVTMYRTSKPTIREALRILETEGLIEVRRGGRAGAQVLQPSVAYAARGVGLLLQIRGTPELGEPGEWMCWRPGEESFYHLARAAR